MTTKRTDASSGELVDAPDSAMASDTSKKSDPKLPPTMHIKVYSPFKTYFDEAALSISGTNATGPFDILPKHHNFLTLLSPGELRIRLKQGGEERIRISGGLMHVKADKVIVFLDV
ncbi:MAG TPA: hypothetical protein VLG16_03755 [Candidatus Saccharimonadales bacterium]|nr:hypothetical protein [Candidatus Saccharimonadales bacterium]